MEDTPIAAPPPPTPTAALAQNLGTTAAESKKYRLVSRALLYTGIVGFLAMVAISVKPQLSGEIVKLATLIIGSITAQTGIYTGVQGATDWKNMAALTNASANK